jgi:GT2 family glycosyltransferase
MIKISIIVCTYNRSKDLVKILENLSCLNSDGSFDHEIILVDNNSKDDTKEIVGSYILKNNKIRYVFEPKQGISHARNAGISHAKGEILAFTDDDVIIEKDWLQNIADFAKDHDFDAVGGKVLLSFPPQTPQWMKEGQDVFWGPIPYHYLGETVKLYDHTMNSFVGANMIIKQNVFKEIGGFDPELGPGSKISMGGEDTAFFSKIQKLNKKIYYNPNIIVHHPVEKNRITLKFIAKWCFSFGYYLIIMNRNPKPLVCYCGIPRYLYREIPVILLTLPFLIFNKHQFLTQWRLLFIRLGMLKAYRI